MTPTEYTEWTRTLDMYPGKVGRGMAPAMYALGLTGEAGEAADKLKKMYRDDKFDATAFMLELGDALYYLARLGDHFGFTLQDIMDANEQKLENRRARGVLSGSGDYR